MGRFEGIFAAFYIIYKRGVFFFVWGKAFALTGRQACGRNNPGRCPGLGASALSGRAVYIGASVLSGRTVYIGASVLSGRAVYIGASVLSGRAAIRLRNFLLHEFCVKFIKKMHGNVGDYKYFVTFALDYENMN